MMRPAHSGKSIKIGLSQDSNFFISAPIAAANSDCAGDDNQSSYLREVAVAVAGFWSPNETHTFGLDCD